MIKFIKILCLLVCLLSVFCSVLHSVNYLDIHTCWFFLLFWGLSISWNCSFFRISQSIAIYSLKEIPKSDSRFDYTSHLGLISIIYSMGVLFLYHSFNSSILSHGHAGQWSGNSTSIGLHSNLCMLPYACFFFSV